MGNAFTDVRLPYAKEWEVQNRQEIQAQGWQVVPMGAENVAPDVQKALSFMENPDSTARFVKYMPDGFAVNIEGETAYFFDSKRGKSIEKDAYIAYIAFAGEDRKMFVMIKTDNGKIYDVPVSELKFLCSHKYVSKFPEHRRMPIDDDGWIAPRLWPDDKYLVWKAKCKNASGTPFKYFDFNKMQQFLRDFHVERSRPVTAYLGGSIY